jgi:hypothetical protein
MALKSQSTRRKSDNTKYGLGNDVDRRQLIREDRRVYESRLEGKLAGKSRRFRLVDAFSGAGGMTLGFSSLFGQGFGWAKGSA